MILAADNFRDTEYITPRTFFEREGFEITTTSSNPFSFGRFGYRVDHEKMLPEFSAKDFDAVLFVGGGGALKFKENTDAQRLAQECLDNQKILGAICAAPRNLLDWGILKGKKCTGHDWDGELENLCKKNGAIYQNIPCVVDGNIITADGTDSVEEWAHTIINLL